MKQPEPWRRQQIQVQIRQNIVGNDSELIKVGQYYSAGNGKLPGTQQQPEIQVQDRGKIKREELGSNPSRGKDSKFRFKSFKTLQVMTLSQQKLGNIKVQGLGSYPGRGNNHKYRFKPKAKLEGRNWEVGLYRTSRPVRKSGKFSKSGLSGHRTFSFPDAGLF